MCALQINGGNKLPVPDAQTGFSGGQFSFLRTGALKLNEAVELVNVDIDRYEDAVTRRGTDYLGEYLAIVPGPCWGMAYFDTPSLEQLVRLKKNPFGVMEVWTHDGIPSSSWNAVSGWTPAETPCDIVQGNDKLYFANGTDNLRSYDGAALTDMGTGYPNPPKYKYLLYATNRLIGWGDAAAPDTLGFSNILGESVWSGTNTLRAGAGEGDPIVFCELWTRTLLLVVKQSSAKLINIDPATTVANMPIDDVSAKVGGVGRRAFAKVGKDIWFMTKDGIRSVQRVLSGEDTDVTPPLSDPVRDLFAARNQAADATICCTSYGKYFFCALPTGNSTQPDCVIVARVTSAGAVWLGKWTGWAPTVWVTSDFGGAKRLNFGNSSGFVQRWRDFTRETDETEADYKDGIEEIATTIETRAMKFGDGDAWKQGFTVEAEFNTSRASIEITPRLDGVLSDAPVITASSGVGVLTFPWTFPLYFPAQGNKRVPGTLMHQKPFREIAFRVESPSAKLALRSVNATAFLKTMQVKAQ